MRLHYIIIILCSFLLGKTDGGDYRQASRILSFFEDERIYALDAEDNYVLHPEAKINLAKIKTRYKSSEIHLCLNPPLQIVLLKPGIKTNTWPVISEYLNGTRNIILKGRAPPACSS